MRIIVCRLQSGPAKGPVSGLFRVQGLSLDEETVPVMLQLPRDLSGPCSHVTRAMGISDEISLGENMQGTRTFLHI